MKEVYILERSLAPGVWELVNTVFYTDRKEALKDLLHYMEGMKSLKKDPTARVTTLKLNKNEEGS